MCTRLAANTAVHPPAGPGCVGQASRQTSSRRGGNWLQGGRPYSGTGGRRGGAFQGASPKRVVSDSLRNSMLLRGAAANAISAREAVILMSLINHPELAEEEMERLAALDFDSPEARKLLGTVIDLIGSGEVPDGEPLSARVAGLGFGDDMARMDELLRRQGIWQWGEDVALIDAQTGLHHALALHYKSVQLNRELKAAELALGQDPSEESFERLKDIQNQIASVDGTEALIEGFGSLSGRATPGF